jgi:glycosyltransferase involved in cell wall biosynthesis
MINETIASIHINESGAPTGGAERYLIALHQALETSGNPAILVFGRNEPNTYLPTGKSMFISGLDLPEAPTSATAMFLSLLETQAPDLIHFHNLNNTGLITLMAAAQSTVRTVHDSRLVCPLEFRLKKDGSLCREAAGPDCLLCMNEFGLDQRSASDRLSQTLAEIEATKKLAIILTPSNYIREQLLLNGFEDKKIVVLPPFLLNEPGKELAAVPETTDLLFVGRVVQSKGLHLLLESMASLPESTTLTVVGDGPDLDTNKGLARDLGLENRINFVGWQPAANLNRHYQQARILVVPSLGPEAFGLVGLEAMAMSKPVIAFDSGGINQWLHDGTNGFLVASGNTQALSGRINQLLSDEALRSEMGNQSRQMIETQFNRQTHVAKLLAIYQQASN